MTFDTEDSFNAALALPPERRAALATKRLESLEQVETAEVDAAWAEEVERRLEVYDQGKIKGIPADEVFASLRFGKQLRGHHS